MNSKLKKFLNLICMLSITLLIAFLSSTNPISKLDLGTDGNVFSYIIKRLNSGDMIYKDMFDHKGPLFFFIYWFGTFIGGGEGQTFGLWLCQIIAIFLAILFTQKILKEKFKFSNFESIIINLIININLIFFLDGGNLTELYAYSAITVALYFILTCKKENLKMYHFILGVLLGIVLSLKGNIITLWVSYYLMVLLKCIKDKNFKTLLNIIIFTSLGLGSFLSIVSIYLILNNAFIDCIKDYVLFNFKYSTTYNIPLWTILVFFVIESNIPIYFVIIISYIVSFKNNKGLTLFSLLSFILTWFITIQPRNTLMHYGMILVPTFIIPIALLYKYIKNIKNQKIKCILLPIIILFVLIVPTSKYTTDFININIKEQPQNVDKAEVISQIKNGTNKDDTILVIGNDCSYYLLTDRKAASKYMYQFPIYRSDESILDQTINDIKANTPKYIFVLTYQTDEKLFNTIISEINGDYSLVKKYNIGFLYKLDAKFQ